MSNSVFDPIQIALNIRQFARDDAEKQLALMAKECSHEEYENALLARIIDLLAKRCVDLMEERDRQKALNKQWTTEVPTTAGNYMVILDEEHNRYSVPQFIKIVGNDSFLYVTLGKIVEVFGYNHEGRGFDVPLAQFVAKYKPTHWKEIPFDVPPDK